MKKKNNKKTQGKGDILRQIKEVYIASGPRVPGL